MFADPITITVNAVAKSLVKINQDSYGSEYFLREATQEFRLRIRNTTFTPKGGRITDRHNVEFTNVVYATETVASKTRKAYSVFEHERSDTDTLVAKGFVGHAGFLTEANINKLLNYES